MCWWSNSLQPPSLFGESMAHTSAWLYFQIHLRTQLPIVCILVVVNDASKRGKEEGAFPRIVQTKRQRISSPIRIGNAILNPMFLYTPILKPFSAVKVWTLRISDTRTIVPVCVWVFQSFLETDNSCGITDTSAPPQTIFNDNKTHSTFGYRYSQRV